MTVIGSQTGEWVLKPFFERIQISLILFIFNKYHVLYQELQFMSSKSILSNHPNIRNIIFIHIFFVYL